MWTKENIERELTEIFMKHSGVDFKNDSLKREKLFSDTINLKARDLVMIMDKIENRFCVHIPTEYICSGSFDTYEHIAKILVEITT